jgi:hypothetical protein
MVVVDIVLPLLVRVIEAPGERLISMAIVIECC